MSETTLGNKLSGPWIKASSTSFLAPEVTGMIAKYLTVHPETTPRQIMTDFETAVRNIPEKPRDGAGLADYRAAVSHRQPDSVPRPAPVPTPDPTTATAIVQSLAEHTVIYFDENWLTDTEYTVRRQTESDDRTVLAFEPLSDGAKETDRSE